MLNHWFLVQHSSCSNGGYIGNVIFEGKVEQISNKDFKYSIGSLYRVFEKSGTNGNMLSKICKNMIQLLRKCVEHKSNKITYIQFYPLTFQTPCRMHSLTAYVVTFQNTGHYLCCTITSEALLIRDRWTSAKSVLRAGTFWIFRTYV